MSDKSGKLFGRLYNADIPDGGGYMMSRGLVIEGVLEQGIESIMNGKEMEGERMDYIWGRSVRDRQLRFVDATVSGGVRTFSIVHFRDEISREAFIIRYRLYGDSLHDAGLMLKGRIN